MKRETLLLTGNRSLTPTVFELTFSGASPMRAGQFVELEVEGRFLRRPISVGDSGRDGTLKLLVKTVGVGTDRMSRWQAGKEVSALTCLGNGFDLSAEKPLLVGGGIGCAPLFMLARKFAEKGVRPTAVLGFQTASEIYYKDNFARYADVIVATDDGSEGYRGNAVAALRDKGFAAGVNFDRYYACGPAVMLRALSAWSTAGQLSLEARMGCGFGACMGCSIKTTDGFRRVCKEGPVFEAASVIWE